MSSGYVTIQLADSVDALKYETWPWIEPRLLAQQSVMLTLSNSSNSSNFTKILFFKNPVCLNAFQGRDGSEKSGRSVEKTWDKSEVTIVSDEGARSLFP